MGASPNPSQGNKASPLPLPRRGDAVIAGGVPVLKGGFGGEF